jgi:hypothetical protein
MVTVLEAKNDKLFRIFLTILKIKIQIEIISEASEDVEVIGNSRASL